LNPKVKLNSVPLIPNIELIDDIIKEGMTEAHTQALYVKDMFRDNPRGYDHFEMNLNQLYRQKLERENKHKIKEEQERLKKIEEEKKRTEGRKNGIL
jgi:hypothetical protein